MQLNMYVFLCLMRSEGHDLLVPYQFMCEEALDTTFDLLADMLSSFGMKQPLGPVYKAHHTVNPTCSPCPI